MRNRSDFDLFFSSPSIKTNILSKKGRRKLQKMQFPPTLLKIESQKIGGKLKNLNFLLFSLIYCHLSP